MEIFNFCIACHTSISESNGAIIRTFANQLGERCENYRRETLSRLSCPLGTALEETGRLRALNSVWPPSRGESAVSRFRYRYRCERAKTAGPSMISLPFSSIANCDRCGKCYCSLITFFSSFLYKIFIFFFIPQSIRKKTMYIFEKFHEICKICRSIEKKI
ncbi:hypothetical protein PUN28_008569 [Cardiocondyla obscurior]|uniref:Uncharacterized protein n=1 Tax=Cardiocondyla obscurior TaxID=286306 RepID=A0AAW2G0J6_9HYME